MPDSLSDLLHKYFPSLTEKQKDQFCLLPSLYEDWNKKMNLISRRDIVNLAERHILHSLSIARIIRTTPGMKILDVGTGGGFPGIPLAVFFPECHFLLADSTGKKIKAVKDIAKRAGIRNVRCYSGRAEEIGEKFSLITGRAVEPLNIFCSNFFKKLCKKPVSDTTWGVIYLSGADAVKELSRSLFNNFRIFYVDDFFPGLSFSGKAVFHIF